MAIDDPVRISADLAVPLSELSFKATRSGGPGGQHVNTSSTRIELTWNVQGSASLSAEQRQLLLDRLANRIDGEGGLRLVSQAHRSQFQNRKAVVQRFIRLIAEGLTVDPPRKATKPSRATRERRLREKRIRSARKRDRARGGDEE